MKYFFPILVVLMILAGCKADKQSECTWDYPVIEPDTAIDVYFGTTVIDPYRNLENLDDTFIIEWYRAQDQYARSVIDSIPGRQYLIDMMREFDSRISSRTQRLRVTDNDYYFYLKTTPQDETGKLYYRIKFEGEEVLLFDPETYGDDSTRRYVINNHYPSYDGSKVAFTLSVHGSESKTIYIMDLQSRKLYSERIDRCWIPRVSWLPDGSAFLYNRLQSSDVHQKDRELNSKVWLHVVGTDPSEDKLIFSRDKYPELDVKPEEMPVVIYGKISGYLYGMIATVDNKMNVYYAPVEELNNDKINWKRLMEPSDEIYDWVATEEDLYLLTPKNASNFKILKTPIHEPDIENAKVIIPEDPEAILMNYAVTSDALYYTISRNGVQEKLYSLPHGGATPFEIELPFAAGEIYLDYKNSNFPDLWIVINGWANDYTAYRYHPDTKEFTVEMLSDVAEYPEYENLVVEELLVKSHDGEEVPLSLIYKEGLKKKGRNHVFIYGYGAYGFSISPFFSAPFLLWVHEGGILAFAHVRGGGEKGDLWHKEGFKTTKPNTWKDLIACTEYLIDEKYTSPGKIAICGGSAGGILIGRAMTERPDLFAAAIPEVGCMNPLRAEESPNGPINVPEFGTVKDSVECMALIEMDSYLHLKDGEKYPATLVTAGMNDPRVIAWQPGKFAARLQGANASVHPVLFRADFESGHGMGDTKSKMFGDLADILSFGLWQTGHPKYQPLK